MSSDVEKFDGADEQVISAMVRNVKRAREARRRIVDLGDAPQSVSLLAGDGLVKSLDRLGKALECLVNLLEGRGDLFLKDSGGHVVSRTCSTCSSDCAGHDSSSRLDTFGSIDSKRGDSFGGGAF